MNEEEKVENIQEEQEAPEFPYPYPTLRGVVSVFLIYGLMQLAPLWDSGVLPNVLLGVIFAVGAVLIVYLFLTSYKGTVVRRAYALKMEAICREEIKAQMAEEAKELEKKEQTKE